MAPICMSSLQRKMKSEKKEACTKVHEKLHGTGFEKLYELFTILIEQAHNNNM